MARTTRRLLTRRPRLALVVTVVAVALALQVVGAKPAVSQSQGLIAYQISDIATLSPTAGVWHQAPPVEVPLSSQQVAWPFGGGSIRLLEARALHTDDTLFIRMSWSDRTNDSQALAVDQFIDAAAIEFPAVAASSVPALCMGQADGGVNIWQWRAGSEEGLPDTIEDLSPGGYVDRYPSTEQLYFPAREAGNPIAAPSPVQNLVAVGFGTLTPAVDQDVGGTAVWERGRWSVVFTRDLSHPGAEQIELSEGASADIAFAVWDGDKNERNGIKSVSPFVVLDVVDEEFPRAVGVWLAIMIGASVAVGAFVLNELSMLRRTKLAPTPEPA